MSEILEEVLQDRVKTEMCFRTFHCCEMNSQQFSKEQHKAAATEEMH